MMESLHNLHFIRTGWLVLVPLVFALWWAWSRHAEPLRGWRAQMAPELLHALVIGRNAKRSDSSYWVLTAWLVAAIAIAGPTWRLEPNPFAEDAAPLMILLKADQSMLQPNPAPSRMERAHLKITDLAKARQGQPLGLIAYAGSAHLVLPPTRDTDVVAQMANEITPNIMPVAGDRLDLAIQKATQLLRQEAKGGSLLVVADSAQLDAKALSSADPSQARLPIEFLALTGTDTPETQSLREAARALGASVQVMTVDDADISAVIDFAERRAASGMAGKSSRWQEAGYWLTPLLALVVALSFRRQVLIAPEGTR